MTTPDSPNVHLPLTARERLKNCWCIFKKMEGTVNGVKFTTLVLPGNISASQAGDEHQAAIQDLIASGELGVSVADVIHKTYIRIVYYMVYAHSTTMCYRGTFRPFNPLRAEMLFEQLNLLEQIRSLGTVDPETIEKLRSSIEYDMTYFAMSAEEENAFHSKVDTVENFPFFDKLFELRLKDQIDEITAGRMTLELADSFLDKTADARAAGQYLLDLLQEK
jgi:hypothetical protein